MTSLHIYLASKRIFSSLDISNPPQVGRKTQARPLFFQMIWCLGRCDHCKGANASSKSIQLIELYQCVCIRSPSFLYQERTLLRFSAVRSSSNSSSISEDMMLINQLSFFLFPKIIFAIHIQTSNLQEPPQLSSLILAPPFFFTESTDQQLK